jgi:predicted RNase H-like HicB family nuclease
MATYDSTKARRDKDMAAKLKMKMIYWKGEKFWVGKLLEHPEIMTQGISLEELEENMKDAYMLMTMEDIPAEHGIKELALTV